MNNVASILILAFLAISFIQSGYDKLFYWKDNLEWLKEHFSKTPLKNHVGLALLHILVLELISGILCVVGCIELVINNGRLFGFYGAVFSCITLIMLLFGQRLAKDYDGARTIVIYFIPAVMAVYWLN
ncbi:DoxX family membrane protein [Flavobacterium muglaense]|uniref:DoxX family membrane protein n=1 Tax=Flavobacterium muglaense TaxID=2764716 RepID=A0A923SFA0_9FLAO|nr:DoxX family membrane protein [Flavobacterium muglaense]MBC5837907.1 DoxX family membrane protein [Flavobacterium muglaense]MBC5844376.1 DoxX family membrane protein [Flavobacterium muglaense]